MAAKNYLLGVFCIGLTTAAFARENVHQGLVNHSATTPHRVNELCTEPTAQIDLKINDIRARVFSGGDMWWDLNESAGTAQYEVPKGSGKTSLFSGSVWLGGYDATGNLKVAGQTYRQQGANEFFTGPIGVDGGNLVTDKVNCDKYDRVWSVTKSDVQNFVNTNVATKDIREWPGNGDPDRGELVALAPFEDVDGDGRYDVDKGDYPRYLLNGEYPSNPNNPSQLLCDGYIYGDQTLWWVFNDIGATKTETNSPPLGIEVRGQAFAFATDDEINRMTFYKYEIVNRSNTTFDSTYFGWWVDADLGYAFDDYIGCDVGLGLGYCYNGDNNDDLANGEGYGVNPPAVGADFFQGPLADPGDGIDNDKDGVIDEAGEQIIMSIFGYYDNTNNSPYGNPNVADDYYQYLTGSWGDGIRWTRDGQRGRTPPDASNPVTNYLFPGTTDSTFAGASNWTEATANNPVDDRRFLQSAGEFTLKPGAVNYITVGMVWARASSGGNLASVDLLKSADAKAQGLFNNCFKTLDGPDAPDVQITELNNKIILSLKNFNNDKVEKYSQADPSIPAIVQPDDELRKFKFQGYLVFQVSSPSINAAEIFDPSKSTAEDVLQGDNYRLLYQVDLKDSISKLVNYFWSEQTQSYRELVMAFGQDKIASANTGLKHSWEITTDAFNGKPLINHKSYYYLVVSYAYNNHTPFQYIVPSSSNPSQQKPMKVGRNNNKVMSAIPHSPVTEFNGLIFNSEIGDGIQVQRIEGQGNAGRVINMLDEEVDKAVASPYINVNPIYEFGQGPLNVTVYDPLYVEEGNFDFKLTGVDNQSKWSVKEETTNSGDTSSYSIEQPNSQIIQTHDLADNSKVFEWGLTADISNNVVEAGSSYPGNNNAFLGATMTFADSTAKWLTGVKDDNSDISSAFNWIRASDWPGRDTLGAYEKVLNGTWAPFKLANNNAITFGPKYKTTNNGADDATIKMNGPNGIFSVDIVFTKDTAKWTRCPVFEIGDVDTLNEGNAKRHELRNAPSVDKEGRAFNSPGANNDMAGLVRQSGMGWFPGFAVNIETGERLNMAFSENSSLVDDHGRDMVWNPTSRTTDGNGKIIFGGMHYIYVFNARTTTGTNDIGRYDLGQKFVDLLTATPAPSGGNKNQIFSNISWVGIPLLENDKELLQTEVRVKIRIARPFRSFNTNFDTNTYVNLGNGGVTTILRDRYYYVLSGSITAGFNSNSFPYNTGATILIPSDTISNPGRDSSITAGSNGAVLAPSENGGYPHYKFGNEGLKPTRDDRATATSALDLINVVPNPYYAYSSYDKTTNNMWAKITNLPSNCTISIFTVNGTLIRRFKRSAPSSSITGAQVGLSQGTEAGSGNYDTSVDWDLKNDKNIPISSGLYLIHVEAPGLGERTLKWFGVMRPISLDSY